MNSLAPFALVAFAGLIHAGFQLSVSVLTLLSSHTLGSRRSHRTLLGLTGGFVLGAIIMTTLFVSFLIYLGLSIFGQTAPDIVWAGVSGLAMGLGFAVWMFYYRRGDGTALWLPRSMARFLHTRSKTTRQGAESFSLGVTSVLAEGIFIAAPAAVAALTIAHLAPSMQLAGLFTYVSIASLPLIVIYVLVGSGHKLNRIQAWREHNKRFLQFIAGSALLVLGFYTYTEYVLTAIAVAGGRG